MYIILVIELVIGFLWDSLVVGMWVGGLGLGVCYGKVKYHGFEIGVIWKLLFVRLKVVDTRF